MSDISTEEWLAELEAAMLRSGEDGITVTELCAATDRGPDWVKKRLRALRESGRLAVGRAQRESVDGIMRKVPVYRIVGGAK